MLRLFPVFYFNIFLLSAGNSHAHMNEDRQRQSDFCNRMVSEPNVFLDSFSYPDNSQASDTVSVDSSDSLETSFSACSPDNISRSEKEPQWPTHQKSFLPSLMNLVLFVVDSLCFPFITSASTSNMAKIEEMERLLREAQAEKLRLLEHRVINTTSIRTAHVDMHILLHTLLPCAGAGDGDAQAGPGGGAEKKRGTGEKAAGGNEQKTEACRERGEAQREAEITGINKRKSREDVEIQSLASCEYISEKKE